jgi:hypothetical protein
LACLAINSKKIVEIEKTFSNSFGANDEFPYFCTPISNNGLPLDEVR